MTTAELLMKRAGLPASAAELIEIDRSDAAMQSLIEVLYAVPDARYAEPALVFKADVTMARWDEG